MSLLEVKNLSKSFPGVRALSDVSLTLEKGEVLSVIGENGAGKSTLMKILAGVQVQDRGQILIDGKTTSFTSTKNSMDQGIVLIHQELNLCDNLTVGQNIFLGHEPQNRFGFLRFSKIASLTKQYLERVGLEVSHSTVVGNLTIGKQQMVEIAKALSIDARILIMDEPTSSLSSKESELLFQLIESLSEQGVSIIYISHRLAEVKRLSDRVVVLRDGQFVGELKRPEINHDSMVSMMVGRDISQVYKRTPSPTGDTVLKLQGIRTPTWPKHEVSCQVKSGEIVGLAGLVGSGRTELLNTIFGIDQPIGGKILIQGKPVDISSPIVAIDHGLALVPEDRKLHGLVTEMSVQNNIGLASLQRNANRFGIADFRTQKSQTKTMIEKLSVKTPGPHQISKFLSGGNQQKVVLGKWLTMSPQLLLLDEPTRGIDVGAKQEIYQLMEQLAKEGMGVLFVSSELEEILGLADRVYVMHEGKITGELARDQLSEEAIMQLATDSVTS